MVADEGDDLLAVPGVVAEGDDVRPGFEHRPRHVRRQAEAVRGVLPVHDRQIDAQPSAQLRQRGEHRLAAGAPDNIAQEQNAHHASRVKFRGR